MARGVDRVERVFGVDERDDAAHGLGHDVIAGALSQRALQAEARDIGVDDPGIDLPHGLIGKAQLLQHAHLVVLADHIRSLQQAAEDFLALLRLQVQRDPVLVAVEAGVEAALAVFHGSPGADLIPRTRALDLDDLCAVIGQVHRTEGAGIRLR